MINILERAYSTFYQSFVGALPAGFVFFSSNTTRVVEAAAVMAGSATLLSVGKNLALYFASKGNGPQVP